jgi:threonine aldolase
MIERFIDLRSDTVTKPTPEMLRAMSNAVVGDDVFGDDPTVNQLEQMVAEMFGMESSLFCASGTMTNQLAIRVHCSPGSEIICDKLSHIYLYEGGGAALNAFSSIRALEGNRGRLTASQVEDAINDPRDFHLPVTRLVSLENTVNKGGGCFYDFGEIRKIRQVCSQHNLALHLDGARLFNALAETADTTSDYGTVFDSISICLSKGLGCPIGSMLIGKADFIEKAKRFRKVMGGGWRQAGYLAACAIYALENNIDRLKDDHRRAKQIGEIMEKKDFVKKLYPVDTNIVIFELADGIDGNVFVNKLADKGLHCILMGKNLVRFVTHLGFNDNMLSDFDRVMREVEGVIRYY